MKNLIFVIVSLSIVLSSPVFLPKLIFPSKQNLLDFLVGNLASLSVLSSIPDAFPCVTQVTSLKNTTLEALQLFEEGHIVDAIHLLENTINQTLTSCSAAGSEGVDTFKNFLDIIGDPDFLKKASERVIDNLPALIDDLAYGIEKINNQSYFEAGVSFGKIPHLILSGPDSLLNLASFLTLGDNSSCPFIEFMRGFLEETEVLSEMPDAELCATGVSRLTSVLPQVLQLLQQGKVLEAVQLIEQVYQDDVTACTNLAVETTQVFGELVTKMTQPDFVKTAVERVMENLFTLIEDYERGIGDLVKLDFYNAGREIGKIPHLVIDGKSDS